MKTREELIALYEPEFIKNLEKLHEEMEQTRIKYKKGNYTYGYIPDDIVMQFIQRQTELYNTFYKLIGDLVK